MAQGGQLLNGNDFGSVLFPKAAGALSEVRKNNIANDAASTQLGQQKAQMGDLSRVFGGYDPNTKIYWDSGRGDASAGLPSGASSIMSNPMVGMMGRLDPKAVLSGISGLMFAPPKNYVRTDNNTGETKTVLATPLQAMNDQGATYAETGPVDRKIKVGDIEGSLDTLSTLGGGTSLGSGSGSPPVPRGQSSSFVGGAGSGGSVGATAGMPTLAGAFTNALRTANMTPEQRAYATAAGTGRGELQYAGPKAEATAAGTARGGGQFETVTVPDPNNPQQNITVLKSQLPQLYGAQPSAPSTAPDQFGVPGGVAGPSGLANGAMPSVQPRTPQIGVPGGPSPAGTHEQEAAKAEGAMRAKLQANSMMRDYAQKLLDDPDLGNNLGKYGTWGGRELMQWGGNGAATRQTKIDFLQGRSVLDTFQSARDMSPTGGGVGRLTDTEIPIFKNAQAALQQAQSPESYKEQLRNIINLTNQSEANTRDTFRKEYGRDLTIPAAGTSAGGWAIREVK